MKKLALFLVWVISVAAFYGLHSLAQFIIGSASYHPPIGAVLLFGSVYGLFCCGLTALAMINAKE